MSKRDWGKARDHGVKPGHADFPCHQPGSNHTRFDSRPWGGDKGSYTNPETFHTNSTNEHHHEPETRYQTNVEGGHDPSPEKFHKNAGTSSEGHQLVRRGGTVYRGMTRGYRD